jgi:hypothetical protein
LASLFTTQRPSRFSFLPDLLLHDFYLTDDVAHACNFIMLFYISYESATERFALVQGED